jgi:hypothetical protein
VALCWEICSRKPGWGKSHLQHYMSSNKWHQAATYGCTSRGSWVSLLLARDTGRPRLRGDSGSSTLEENWCLSSSRWDLSKVSSGKILRLLEDSFDDVPHACSTSSMIIKNLDRSSDVG